jgi:Glycosyl hydrolases family 28
MGIVLFMKSRRGFLIKSAAGVTSALLFPRRVFPGVTSGAEYDVRKFGAVGDGVTVDTAALQRAIDSAAEKGGGRVLLPGGMRFLTGALMLKSGIDFHLADDAVLLANPDPQNYGTLPGLLNCDTVRGLKISGTGHIDGQAMKFVTTYSNADERWEPMKFRPRMFSLIRATDLEVTGISFGHSPNWGLHMLGCERVLVDGIRIRNFLDVPNCDGMDPDRCRDVEIRNCDIVCADDGIVVKASEQTEDYGPTRNIVVRDCVVTTRDSGLKIGTETFGDISKILFERCRVLSGGRGPTITHRQPGNIEDVEFRDIEVTAEHHAARWWGWGEAISITAWPRVAGGKVGSLRNIRLRNIHGRAENSVRINGQKDQPIEDVLLDHVDVTIDRWTKYPGGRFDNRPTMAGVEGLEVHGTPVFSLRNAKSVTVKDCTSRWGDNRQEYFTNALQAENVQGLKIEHFTGEAAFPATQKAIEVD